MVAGSVGAMTTTTFRVRHPEDLLAAVPILLGFAPEASLVMLTFGGSVQFHGRIDLPRRPEHIDHCVESLLAPAVRHDVRGVAFVLYDAEPALAAPLAQRLAERTDECGVHLAGCLSVLEGRWYDPLGLHGGPPEGVTFSADDHEFRARSVADGHVTLASRAELEATVAQADDAVARTTAALAEAVPLRPAEIRAVLRAGLRGRRLTPDRLASLLLALQEARARDEAWARMRRDDAHAHVALWSDVVRRSPADLVAHPAAVLAFAAWLNGDGALAWCALDRCFAQEPGHSLGLLVARMLERAVPPTEWDRATQDAPHQESA